jgi:signal peptidase I
MFFFTPSHIKHGRQFIKDARKLIAYKRDVASEVAVADVEREITHLEHAVDGRDRAKIEEQMARLNTACGKLTRPAPNAAVRENVEVFLVAIVIALAVRTYFLQPFTIPTGSMQPTLNGIIPYTSTEPAPNPFARAFYFAAFGRKYVDVVAEADEMLEPLQEVQRGGLRRFFTYTRIETSAGNTYYVNANPDTVAKMLPPGKRMFKKGEPIVRGYIETGDHVFVDKLTYNFRRPKRGEVFVFSTQGIPLLNPPGQPSQFYIKRLAGVPNDTLRIDPPHLIVNGKIAQEPGFQRVMSGTVKDPLYSYRGYSNGAESRHSGMIQPMTYLASPQEKFEVPEKNYFALGDNSHYSSDSRQWGTVPQDNVMGRAVFVYWPFTRHWSLIR